MSASNRDTWADGGAGGLLLRPREMTTIIDPVALHPDRLRTVASGVLNAGVHHDPAGSISATIELRPGDFICMGSPSGIGFASGRFLALGNLIEITLGDLPPLRDVFGQG
jgi:hypothetical protein